MENLDLGVQLGQLAQAHSDALRTLSKYVFHVQKGIERSVIQHRDLVQALGGTATPEAVPVPGDTSRAQRRNEELVTISLPMRELAMLKHIANQHHSASERFPRLLLEMAFIYRVALYDAFLFDVLRAVLLSEFGLLKASKKTLTYEQAIELHEGGSLLSHLADKEMLEFSYGSVEKQVRWIRDKLNIELLPKPDDLEKLVDILARRNLLVHNNGVVNDVYLQLVPKSSLTKGERVQVHNDYWRSVHVFLMKIANSLIAALAGKFAPESTVPRISSLTPFPAELLSGLPPAE